MSVIKNMGRHLLFNNTKHVNNLPTIVLQIYISIINFFIIKVRIQFNNPIAHITINISLSTNMTGNWLSQLRRFSFLTCLQLKNHSISSRAT